MLEELRYLSGLAGTGLANDDCDRVSLDDIKQAIVVFGDGQ